MHDREQLWNAAEDLEKRKDAQLCREAEFALPREMSLDEQIALARDYVQSEFVAVGMVADLCIHAKRGNPHAHVLLSLRELTPEGFGKKRREWNSTELVERWRKSWADHCNRALAEAGHPDRIDHRSFAEQGITTPPTVHVGRDNGINTEARVRRQAHNDYVEAVRELERIKAEERIVHAQIAALESEVIDLRSSLSAALAERDGKAPPPQGQEPQLILPRRFQRVGDPTPSHGSISLPWQKPNQPTPEVRQQTSGNNEEVRPC
jgi:ATP-dependent exoDNAse (exonuclease V) alpha subunit